MQQQPRRLVVATLRRQPVGILQQGPGLPRLRSPVDRGHPLHGLASGIEADAEEFPGNEEQHSQNPGAHADPEQHFQHRKHRVQRLADQVFERKQPFRLMPRFHHRQRRILELQ